MPSRSSSRSKSAARSPAAPQTEDPQRQQLAEATAALAQRNAELAVINSIQQGLVAQLDLMAIIDLVGDKLRAVFDTGNIHIAWFDEATFMVTPVYSYEHGKQLFDVPPMAMARSERNLRVVQQRQTVGTSGMPPGTKAYPGTLPPKSDLRAPVVAGDKVIAVVTLTISNARTPSATTRPGCWPRSAQPWAWHCRVRACSTKRSAARASRLPWPMSAASCRRRSTWLP